ncbi:MAG: hypothetical protein JNK21_04805 [Rhodospirillaceae bacterium]|nr:hypothetical protein [Rhodospirillaceae bacterium]
MVTLPVTITRRAGLGAITAAAAAPFMTPAQANPMTVQTASGPITPALFNAWIALRGGEDGPGYWYSDGLVRTMADGAVDSRMIGVETWITPKDLRTETSAVSISRKVYFFLERGRDVIVTDKATGKPRRPSIFAYQVRTFRLKDGAIEYSVESHDTVSPRMGGAGSVYTITATGDQVHVNYAVFRTVPEKNGATSARGEIYDYFDHGPALKEMHQRYQGTWSSANTLGQMANLMNWRYPSFDAIPNEWLKAHIRKNGPMWMAPPRDMAEIDALRKTAPIKTDLIPV